MPPTVLKCLTPCLLNFEKYNLVHYVHHNLNCYFIVRNGEAILLSLSHVHVILSTHLCTPDIGQLH